ncbi:MAG: DUF3047 domain-containing protein [Burkholderiaceae bacterium]
MISMHVTTTVRVLVYGTAALVMALLASCTSLRERQSDAIAVNSIDSIALSRWAAASASGGTTGISGRWLHQEFPGKRASSYRYARLDGRDTVAVQSSSAASMLRQVVRVEAADLGRLRFSWKVPALIAGANLRDRHMADSPVRVVLAFEGDRSQFGARDAMLSELAHALTGEPMPYATLMYVWGNQSAAGTVLHNTRTSRIRKLVMESGPGKLSQWLDYERDVRADFEKAFGEPPGALVSIGIMTDTDNTRSTATAWYGPIRHTPVKDAAP